MRSNFGLLALSPFSLQSIPSFFYFRSLPVLFHPCRDLLSDFGLLAVFSLLCRGVRFHFGVATVLFHPCRDVLFHFRSEVVFSLLHMPLYTLYVVSVRSTYPLSSAAAEHSLHGRGVGRRA